MVRFLALLAVCVLAIGFIGCDPEALSPVPPQEEQPLDPAGEAATIKKQSDQEAADQDSGVDPE